MSRRTLKVDDALHAYLVDHSIREHPAQQALRAATASHPHGGMQISPEQGQFMALLVKLVGARRAIEVGVFTGYSALTVALALPDDGFLLACDISDEYTASAAPSGSRPASRARSSCAWRRRARRSMRTWPRGRRAATTSPSSTPTRPATTTTTSVACG